MVVFDQSERRHQLQKVLTEMIVSKKDAVAKISHEEVIPHVM